MATRLPYYTGEDDIYSRLMAQYAQELPYYSSAPVASSPISTDVLGGYDPGLYSRPTAPAMPMPNRLPGASGLLYEIGPSPDMDNPSGGWDKMTDLQKAEYYANNPGMGKFSQFVAGIFGKTPVGALQRATVPDFVNRQNLIHRGLNPDTGLPVNLSLDKVPASIQEGLLSGLDYVAPLEDQGFGSYGENVAPSASMGNDVDGFGSYGENVAPSGAPAPGAIDGGYGAYGENVAPSGDGGGGGDGGSKMICTKLHELGKMPEEIFVADQAFGALMAKDQPETYDGYAVWARHVVRWMSREDWIGKAVVGIVHKIATPWSVAMAEQMGVNVKSNWFGRLLMTGGLQVCKMIGKITQLGSLKNV
jgi:hypothetical protein